MNEKRQQEGQVIRLLRIQKQLSQQEFAKQVFSVTSERGFKLVSRIETGALALKGEHRYLVEKFFGVSIASLMTDARVLRGSVVALRPNDQYFNIHEGYISQAVALAKTIVPPATSPADVWFFHAAELPVLRDRLAKRQWVKNIQRSVNMHLVWPIPVTSKEDIQAFFDLGIEVLNAAKNDPGQKPDEKLGNIIFWGIDWEEERPFAPARSYYNDLPKDDSLSNLGLIVKRPIEKTSILKDILTLRSVVFNVATVITLPPYAATYFDDVGSDKDGEWVSGWLFNGKRTSSMLHTIVKDMIEVSIKVQKQEH